MLYLKSILAGLLAVVGAVVLLVVLTSAWLFLQTRRSGSGGIGATSVGVGPLLLIVLVVIFAGGFWWEFTRASR